MKTIFAKYDGDIKKCGKCGKPSTVVACTIGDVPTALPLCDACRAALESDSAPIRDSDAYLLTSETRNKLGAVAKSLMEIWSELPYEGEKDSEDSYHYCGGLLTLTV